MDNSTGTQKDKNQAHSLRKGAGQAVSSQRAPALAPLCFFVSGDVGEWPTG